MDYAFDYYSMAIKFNCRYEIVVEKIYGIRDEILDIVNIYITINSYANEF